WLRRAGVFVIAARLVLVVLVFDPRAALAFTIAKTTAAHAADYLLLALAVVYLLRHRGRTGPAPRLVLAAAPLLAAYVAASVLAVHVPTALYGAWDRRLGLSALLDGVALLCAIALFVRTRRDLLVLLAASGAATILVLLYGAVQAVGRDPIDWNLNSTSP